MDDFYIVLPSNTPIEGNKTSKFIVRLPETLELDSNWSVSLSSIIYPHSFSPLGSEGDEYIEINEYTTDGKLETIKLTLPDMNFNTISGLEKKINGAIDHYYELEKAARGGRVKRATKEKELQREKIDKPLTREEQKQDKPLPREEQKQEKTLQKEKPKQEKTLQREEPKVEKQLVREEIDQTIKEGLEAAKRAAERAWNESNEYAKQAEEFATWSQGKRRWAELEKRKAPIAPDVKEWFAKLLLKADRLQTTTEQVIEESKKVRIARDETFKFAEKGQLREAKKAADNAKVAANIAKNLKSVVSQLYYKAAPENDLGVHELANRVFNSVFAHLNPPEQVPPPAEEPKYPPGHPNYEGDIDLQKKTDENKPEKDKELPKIDEPVKEKTLQKETKTEKVLTKEKLKPEKDLPKETKITEESKEKAETKVPIITDEEIVQLPPMVPTKEPVQQPSKIILPPNTFDDDEDGILSLPRSKTREDEKKEIKTFHKWEQNILPTIYEEEDLPFLPKPEALVSGPVKERNDLIYAKPAPRFVEFRFDHIDQRFVVFFGPMVRFITISEQLAYVLGYKRRRLYESMEADYMPDLTGGVKQMYIYAPNLVENTIIGDRLAPLLRIVNVVGELGIVNEIIYSTEYFHRLQSKRITEISIEIQTPFGELVKFQWGNCVLTLHFKRTIF